MIDGPIKLPTIKIPMDKPNPPIGIGNLAWSFDRAFLASKNGKIFFSFMNYGTKDNMPNVLWIWDM